MKEDVTEPMNNQDFLHGYKGAKKGVGNQISRIYSNQPFSKSGSKIPIKSALV